eukprot:7317210-Prymnesium_polylepis.1
MPANEPHAYLQVSAHESRQAGRGGGSKHAYLQVAGVAAVAAAAAQVAGSWRKRHEVGSWRNRHEVRGHCPPKGLRADR